MLYIINKEIYFSDSDGTVWTGEKNESTLINLTVTTSRLLTYLLERQGVVSTRDDILDKVWLSHGLRSSNHSLNKYVAELRKVFTTMGINTEVIVTAPRVGFMFTRDVEVERLDLDADNSPSIPYVSSIHMPLHLPKVKKKINSHYLIVIAGVFCLGTLTVFIFSEFLNLKIFRWADYQQNKVYRLGEVGGCPVMTLAQSSNEMTSVKMRMAENIIKESKLQCLDNTVLFFQPSDPAIFGYAGRVFLSRCTKKKDDKEKFASCNSYYQKSYLNEK